MNKPGFKTIFDELIIPDDPNKARSSIKDFKYPFCREIGSQIFPVFNLVEYTPIPSPLLSESNIPPPQNRSNELIPRLEQIEQLPQLPPPRTEQPRTKPKTKSSFNFNFPEEPFHKKPK